MDHLKTLYSWSEVGSDGKMSLFPADNHSPEELLNRAKNIDQYCFYGRCFAFQVNKIFYKSNNDIKYKNDCYYTSIIFH